MSCHFCMGVIPQQAAWEVREAGTPEVRRACGVHLSAATKWATRNGRKAETEPVRRAA